MARNSYRSGVIILIIGIVILLGKIGFFGYIAGILWPLILLIPGLLFHYFYFARIWQSRVLIPGGILTSYALLFFFCEIFNNYGLMSYIWPGFILGIAVGLYEFYLFDQSNPKGALVAAFILAIMSGVFFGFTLLSTAGIYIIALALIGVGAAMMVRKPRAW